MGWTITRHDRASAFLARAGAWLAEREAENNLILGIAARLESDDHGFGSPVYLATVERGDEVEGCAWRTPPHEAGLTAHADLGNPTSNSIYASVGYRPVSDVVDVHFEER